MILWKKTIKSNILIAKLHIYSWLNCDIHSYLLVTYLPGTGKITQLNELNWTYNGGLPNTDIVTQFLEHILLSLRKKHIFLW